MKIQVIQREFNGNKSYKICDCKYCCEGIKKLPNIDFYFKQTENSDSLIDSNYDCSDIGVMLRKKVIYESWEDRFEEEYYYKLNYCPICGEKIEIEIVDNVDITKEYERLKKECDAINKQCRQTDSKKKEKELISKRRQIDMEIESFYMTDTLPGRDEEDEDY